MHTKFKQFFIAAVTAVSCTAAFSYSLISIAGDVPTQGVDNPWQVIGSASSELPLMLASKGSSPKKSSGSKPKGSKVTIYYCEVKKKGGSGSKPVRFKAKTKKVKGSTQDKAEEKVDKKIAKCNKDKGTKPQKKMCKLGKCGPNESFASSPVNRNSNSVMVSRLQQ